MDFQWFPNYFFTLQVLSHSFHSHLFTRWVVIVWLLCARDVRSIVKTNPQYRNFHLKQTWYYPVFKSVGKGHHFHTYVRGIFHAMCYAAAPPAIFPDWAQGIAPRPRLTAPSWPPETFLGGVLGLLTPPGLSSLGTLEVTSLGCWPAFLIKSKHSKAKQFRKKLQNKTRHIHIRYVCPCCLQNPHIWQFPFSCVQLQFHKPALAKILRWNETTLACAQNWMWWCTGSNCFTATTKPTKPGAAGSVLRRPSPGSERSRLPPHLWPIPCVFSVFQFLSSSPASLHWSSSFSPVPSTPLSLY